MKITIHSFRFKIIYEVTKSLIHDNILRTGFGRNISMRDILMELGAVMQLAIQREDM